jgi:hypothetical protein
MRRTLESESDTKSRRAAGRLLFSKKKDDVNQKADLERAGGPRAQRLGESR